MTFRQRAIQLFFLFLGVLFVVLYAVRGMPAEVRFPLWSLLCPPGTRIELAAGQAELEPGEIVAAYEVLCVGGGLREPLSDLSLILVEMGFTLGVTILLAVGVGWMTTRKTTDNPAESPVQS